MRGMDWRIIGAMLGGGVAGIAAVLLVLSLAEPGSMQGFVFVGAIVLIAILAIQFIRLRQQGPRR
jgi:hypothetical protein